MQGCTNAAGYIDVVSVGEGNMKYVMMGLSGSPLQRQEKLAPSV